jgi:class 3 adenylate cyclase
MEFWMAPDPRLAKYVFLDIVSFSHGRSVEAQTDLVGYLNSLVRAVLSSAGLAGDDLVLLPTGDGLCIAVVDLASPYDVHLTLALSLLESLAAHNEATSDVMRRFTVRIGLNQNVDNLVQDINDKRNVAGAGINMAQRFMSLADGNMIIVGPSVHETLASREKYMSSFRPYIATVKHGIRINVFQYISPSPGLATEVPKAFAPPAAKVTKLTDYEAFHIALCLKHRQFLLSLSYLGTERVAGAILIHMLTTDAIDKADSTGIRPHIPHTFGASHETLQEQVAYYDKVDTYLLYDLARMIENKLTAVLDCFEPPLTEPRIYVNDRGESRLRAERPDVAARILDAP